MSGDHLSAGTRALLRAARADAPAADARARMWTGVSGAIGGAVGAAGVGSALGSGGSIAPAGGMSAAKMLLLGTLLGGTISAGLAMTVLRAGPAPAVPAARPAVVTAAAGPTAATARPDEPPPAELATAPATEEPSPAAPRNVAAQTPASGAQAPAPPNRVVAAPAPRATPDSLAREAALVAQARAALAAGDPQAALATIHTVRALPARQLVPEELAVEAQATRALGRGQDAVTLETQLRTEYPESALAHPR